VTYVIMVMMMSAFGLMSANFNSIAMEPLGAIAGTATSLIGVVVFTGGAVVGGAIGQAFDGTLLPFSAGLAGFGLLLLAMVLWTEKGRLFSRHDV
jgi:DHA1 family bicyclomycin/chloramphenicol resistance-like MFS transporter